MSLQPEFDIRIIYYIDQSMSQVEDDYLDRLVHTYSKKRSARGEKIIGERKGPRLLAPPPSPTQLEKENIYESKDSIMKSKNRAHRTFGADSRPMKKEKIAQSRELVYVEAPRLQQRKDQRPNKKKMNQAIRQKRPLTPPMRFTPLAPPLGSQKSLSNSDDELPQMHRYS